jgi:hypothetical protein
MIRRAVANLLVWCAMSLAAGPLAAQTLWELTPYQVQIYVAIQDAPQLTPQMKQDLQAFVRGRIEALVGSSWNTTVSPASAELALVMLDGLATLQTANLPKESLQADKVILLSLSADVFGYGIAARELDCRTRQWGTTVSRQIAQPALLAGAAVDSVLTAFAPLAQVEKVQGKEVVLRLRAGNLPLRDPKALPINPGTLFRPVLRFNDRDGNIRADRPPQPIPWTYLVTRSVEDTQAHCEIFTGVRSPLSSRRRGLTQQLAVAVLPPERSTRLVVHSRIDQERKLFGYEVYAYSPDDPATTLIGRTALDGQLMIPPAEHPLRLLVIKSGGEFLARLPLVPGLEPKALAGVADDDDRLAVEGHITGLQERIVDLVARRAMLVARIRARLDEGKLEEAQELLSELRQLPNRQQFNVVLEEQSRKFYSSDPIVRRKVDKLFSDTREVMVRNLDPGLIDQVSSEVDQARKSKPAAKTSAASHETLR